MGRFRSEMPTRISGPGERRLLTLRSARALDNVNTPAEYDTARAAMHAEWSARSAALGQRAVFRSAARTGGPE